MKPCLQFSILLVACALASGGDAPTLTAAPAAASTTATPAAAPAAVPGTAVPVAAPAAAAPAIAPAAAPTTATPLPVSPAAASTTATPAAAPAVVPPAVAPAVAPAAPSGSNWGLVRAYFAAGVVLSREEGNFSKQTPYLAFDLDKSWRSGDAFQVNSFFETRLTSIPVSTGADAFLASEKSAEVNAGVYTPFLTTRWTLNGRSQALFLAPLVKAGFSTPTGASVNHFYTSSGAGARIGHFRLSGAPGMAPELISYVDLLYGHFTNVDDGRRRLGVEAVLKVPGTPLVVGFSANIGRSGEARDDLRFFFGTRFDVASVIDKLKQLR